MIISGGDRRLRPQLSMNMPPIVHAQKCFGYRNLDFSRRTGPQIVGPKLLFQIGEMHDLIICRTRYVLLYIKTPIFEF